MRCSVLIALPTFNECSSIGAVLDDLLRDLPEGACIIVADGGSTDGTTAIVETIRAGRQDLVLTENPRGLQSAAVNLAARQFGRDADYLVRCDAHCRYPASYVRRLIDSLERIEADSVVVTMDSAGTTCFQKAIAWVSDTKIGSGGAAHRAGRRSGFVDHGHHGIMRMQAFDALGGYDETFAQNEDAEFDCRLRLGGGRIYLDSDIRITYLPRGTATGLFRQYFGYGHGRSRTVRRHPWSIRARQVAVPSAMLTCAIALAAAPIFPILLVVPAAYLGCLVTASVVLAVRHRSLCALLAGPAAAIMHSAWALGFLGGLLMPGGRTAVGAAKAEPAKAYPAGEPVQ